MAMSRGCTVALIIVAAILLLIIIGIFIVWLNREKVGNYLLDQAISTAETKIDANLPEGYTEAQVHDVMMELKTAIKNGDISGPQIQELAGAFQAAISDNEISKEEGAHLLTLIQHTLGKEPQAPEETPTDSLPDTLQAAPDSA
jgi:cell division protein FtsX